MMRARELIIMRVKMIPSKILATIFLPPVAFLTINVLLTLADPGLIVILAFFIDWLMTEICAEFWSF